MNSRRRRLRNDDEDGEEDNLEVYDLDGQENHFEFESYEAPLSPYGIPRQAAYASIVGSQVSSFSSPIVSVSQVETPPFTSGILESIPSTSQSSAQVE
ncbi:hypothetical protein CDL15_Pgr006105 [Punica granatum]|uniref:Uncharacterized protein n=1 Tax=Punica granatum TaxID=22663 RepID=A0A218VU26_PUNGR|nr:hypothetical protein CDL15_Pgr006105 [Punica granatum]